MLFVGGCLSRSMALVRKTTRPFETSGATDAMVDEAVSFEFGPNKVMLEDLDFFAQCGWFPHDLARLLEEEEVVLKPHDDVVVVYREFFLAGLRFPVHPLVVGVFEEVQPSVPPAKSFKHHEAISLCLGMQIAWGGARS